MMILRLNTEKKEPLRPDDTFNLKKGSCRDLSWMQINLLRQLGIAARFVSGYYYFDMDEPAYELHAWVDVLYRELVGFRS
jgi:transglutaminase-like putative cysteine protease